MSDGDLEYKGLRVEGVAGSCRVDEDDTESVSADVPKVLSTSFCWICPYLNPKSM